MLLVTEDSDQSCLFSCGPSGFGLPLLVVDWGCGCVGRGEKGGSGSSWVEDSCLKVKNGQRPCVTECEQAGVGVRQKATYSAQALKTK